MRGVEKTFQRAVRGHWIASDGRGQREGKGDPGFLPPHRACHLCVNQQQDDLVVLEAAPSTLYLLSGAYSCFHLLTLHFEIISNYREVMRLVQKTQAYPSSRFPLISVPSPGHSVFFLICPPTCPPIHLSVCPPTHAATCPPSV